MRIAFLAHFYPPGACGGAGYYTALLAENLREHGEEVGVLCTDQWGHGRRYLNGRVEEMRNAVPVRRLLVNWRKASQPFDWLYDSPILGEEARAYLEAFRPDVVHISSTYTLSARPVFVAKALGLPVVVHLHDYWFICARTVLLHKDETVCSGPDSPWKCQQCLLAGTKLWHLISAVVPFQSQRQFCKRIASSAWLTRQRGFRGMLGDLHSRRRITLAALEQADALITPTAYARRLLEANGAPKGRIFIMPYGGTWTWARDLRRTVSDRLRIGFLGNVIPIKGVHVLVQAYSLLCKASLPVQLQVWGDTSLAPEYYRTLRQDGPPDVAWGGRYDRKDLARILGGLDVIVVPSIWHETQGIVIQEAFAAGLPVIVSAETSLTESVTPETNGLWFQRGSAADLAHQIRRLLDEPGLLSHLQAGIPAVRDIDDDIAYLRPIYARLANMP